MEYVLIFITAIFVNNIVLSQFLGICPFLGVSKKVETAAGMGMAVAFVLVLSTLVTYLIQKLLLDPFDLGYLQTIALPSSSYRKTSTCSPESSMRLPQHSDSLWR